MLVSKAIINSTKEKVWETLQDKVFYPDKYIPGIVEFEWKERDENEYIRTLYTETDDVVELIIIHPDTFTIESSLVKHIFLKGKLTQRIEESQEGITLVFEQEREITLEHLKDLDMQPALDAAVIQIKELAEKED